MRILDNTYDITYLDGYHVIKTVTWDEKKGEHRMAHLATYTKESQHFYKHLLELGYTLEEAKETFEEGLKLDSLVNAVKKGIIGQKNLNK